VMSMHKLGAGDGYSYLTREVAAGDVALERGDSLTAYYEATGNPPGRWLGCGSWDSGPFFSPATGAAPPRKSGVSSGWMRSSPRYYRPRKPS